MPTRNNRQTQSTRKAAAPRRLRYYLMQFSYTSQAWEDMLKSPSKRDRVAAVKPIVETLGGCFPKIVFPCEHPPEVREKFVSFGDHDVVVLLAFPNDQAAATFAMIISQGHGVTSFKTTPLLAWDEAMAAMDDAAHRVSSYIAPGKGKRP